LQCQFDHLPLRHAPEPSFRERVRKWMRRHPRLASPAGLGGLAAVLMALVVVPVAWSIRQDAQRAREGKQRADEETRLATEEKRQAREQEQRAHEEAQRAEQAQQRVAAALAQFHAFQNDVAPLSGLEDVLSRVELLPEPSAVDRDDLRRDLHLGQRALQRYQIPVREDWQALPVVRHLPAEEREQLQENIGTLLYLLARAELRSVAAAAELCRSCAPVRPVLGLHALSAVVWDSYAVAVAARIGPALQLNRLAAVSFPSDRVPRPVLTQKAALLRLLGREREAAHLRAEAENQRLRNARDLTWWAREQAIGGQVSQAIPRLQDALRQAPQNASAWLLLGLCQENLGEYTDATASYSAYLALRPGTLRATVRRGVMYLRRKEWSLARADFDRVLAAEPAWADVYGHRAAAWEGLKKDTEAIEDLSRALRLEPSWTEVYFLRAELRKRVGDLAGAERDLAQVLQTAPTSPQDWTYRGLARFDGQPEAALADFDRALALDPRCRLALLHKARVLATALNRRREAVHVLDEAIRCHAGFTEILLQRAFLHAQLGERGAAHEDAEEALRQQPTPAMHYRTAGIYALTSPGNPTDCRRALQLLATALRSGHGFDRIDKDLAFQPLHADPAFAALVLSARVLRDPQSPP
jgi:tetratricopeptide (TPR) repeat protein